MSSRTLTAAVVGGLLTSLVSVAMVAAVGPPPAAQPSPSTAPAPVESLAAELTTPGHVGVAASTAASATTFAWQTSRSFTLPKGVGSWESPLVDPAGVVWLPVFATDGGGLARGILVVRSTPKGTSLTRLTSDARDRINVSAFDSAGRMHVLIDRHIGTKTTVLEAVYSAGAWTVVDTGIAQLAGGASDVRFESLVPTSDGALVGLASVETMTSCPDDSCQPSWEVSPALVGNAGGKWHVLHTFDPVPWGTAVQGGVAIDADGEIHVVMGQYYGNAEPGLRDWTETSQGWRSTTVTSKSATFGAVALDRAGVLHVVYMTGLEFGDDDLVYATLGAGGWNRQVTDSTGCRSRVALAFDAANAPFIVWTSAKLGCAFATRVVALEHGLWKSSLVTDKHSETATLFVTAGGRRAIWYDTAAGLIQKVFAPLPSVVSRSPGYGVTGVARNVRPAIGFNVPMSGISTSTVRLRDLSAGSYVSIVVAYDPVAHRVTVRPKALLRAGHMFRLSLSSGIRATTGAALTASSTRFTVSRDATRPTFTTSPRHSATGVSRSATVALRFSEPVRGISGKTIRLKDTATGKYVTAVVRYDAATRRATLNPTGTLVRGHRYVVLVGRGITDRAGNALLATSWAFVTTR